MAALTYDGYTNCLYLDGILRQQLALSNYAAVYYYTGGLAIGRTGHTSSGYFVGSLDDVRIYNRALASNEVSQLYSVPIITSQPQSITTNQGANVSFSVSATGTNGVWYQWQKDGVNLPNATNNIYAITNAQPPSIGNYEVVVTGYGGSVTSSVVSLTLSGVNSALWQGLVAYYPFNGNANDESGYGDNGTVNGAHLTADRFGGYGKAYYFNSTNASSIQAEHIPLPAASQARTFALWIRPEAHFPTNAFQVSSIFGYGSHGDGMQAYVNYETVPHVITLNLNTFGPDLSGRWGAWAYNWDYHMWHHLVYVVSATNSLSIYLDGWPTTVSAPTPNPGFAVTPATFTLGAFEGNYFNGQIDDVRIYNRAISSAEAQELYVAEVGSGPRITNVVSASVSIGQPATMSVAVVGATPFSYQWFNRYDAPVSGATNASFLVSYACATNLGIYRVVVSNALGMASAPVTLTVANPYSVTYLPLSNVQPGTERVTLLANGDFESVAGTNMLGEILASNWNYFGHLTLGVGTNTTLANGNHVSIAYINNDLTAARYQTLNLDPNTEYVLSGYVWNMGDTTNKLNTALDASDVFWDPQVDFGPQYQHADQGYFVYRKFHSAASGTNVQIRAFYDGFRGTGTSADFYPLAAQWDNIAVTKASEFVPPAITLPIIVSQPGDRTVVATSSLQMPVQLQSTLPVSFQWFKDGHALSAATDRVLTLANVGAQDAGIYAVVVTNAYGAITSSPARLTVQAITLPGVLAGPITNLANGHIYYVLQASSWVEAQQAAVRLGGNLATIRNADEQDWIWRTCRVFDTSHYFWIGLLDPFPFINSTNALERRTEFRWVSGEPVTYSNWLAVEPNNSLDRGEFYGNLYPVGSSNAGYWNDMYEGSTTRGPGIAEVIPTRTAVATANLFGAFLVAVNITDGGSGYTNAPAVRFLGGGGRGAQAVAVVSNGVVVAINVFDAGYGYTHAPVVVIDPPFIPNPVLCIAPMSYLSFSNIAVGGVYQLQKSVAWYWSNVPVSFTATNDLYTQLIAGVATSEDYRLALNPVPTQAFATAMLNYGFVVHVTITSGGSGYITSPAVAISGGGGIYAGGFASLSGGVVTGITITNAGYGYTNTPTVRIAPPPAAAISPTVWPVVRLDSSNLAPYEDYQTQFKQGFDDTWVNWGGGLFTSAGMLNAQYLFLTNHAGIFRLKHVK